MPAFSTKRIGAELSRGRRAATANERGLCLEDLARYLLCKIPGLRLSDSRIRTTDGAEEIDLVFWNGKAPDGLSFLDHIILVECKNWQRPVATIDVNHFATKLSHRHLRFGILVATAGVTGGDEGRAARAMIEHHYRHSQLTIVVVTEADILALRNTDQFIRLIQDRISSIVLQAVG